MCSKSHAVSSMKGCRMAIRYQIEDGPGKFDLMLSLFTRSEVAFRAHEQKQVSENAWQHNQKDPLAMVEVKITLLERVDNVGDEWTFLGNVLNGCTLRFVKGYYSVKRRKGTMVCLS